MPNHTDSLRSTPIPSRAGTPSFRDVVRDVIKNFKHEKESEAHQIFREAAGHQPKGVLPQTINPDEETVPGILHPGSTGVIYCSDRAMANGFNYASSHEWANLGQGAPEVGPIPDAPPRPTTLAMPLDSLEYAPTTGVKALRETVAKMYNETYREGMESQYTYENVCIVPGGRAGLSRVAAVIGDVYTSYQIPDYTAYDQVLGAFKRLVPVPTALEAENNYRLDIEEGDAGGKRGDGGTDDDDDYATTGWIYEAAAKQLQTPLVDSSSHKSPPPSNARVLVRGLAKVLV